MKYTLRVHCEHDGHPVLEVPFTLTGSESVEEAKSRFHDAIIVAAYKQAEFHGRRQVSMSRIDGIPTEEEAERLRLFEAITKGQ